MAHECCFDLLGDIENLASEIRFSKDARLTELFEKTVAGDKIRQENVEAEYREIVAARDMLMLQLEEHQKALHDNKEKLKTVEKKLKDKENMPKTKMTEDALEKLRQEIKSLLMVLQIYKDFTGVRFECKNFPEALGGCVLVKGSIPTKSVIRPFFIKKPYLNAAEEIWSEIYAAVENQL